MNKINILNIKLEKTNKYIEFPQSIDISLSNNYDKIVSKIIRVDTFNHRSFTANTKNKSDLSFSTRKIKPQKGTGTARRGSLGSCSTRGGYVAHGPHPKNVVLKINKKERQLAKKYLLEKFLNTYIEIIDEIKLDNIKTKDALYIIKDQIKNYRVLFIDNNFDNNFILATKNIYNITLENNFGIWQTSYYHKIYISQAKLNEIQQNLYGEKNE